MLSIINIILEYNQDNLHFKIVSIEDVQRE